MRFQDLAGLGDPAEAAAALRRPGQGADEIVFLDIGAAPERRGRPRLGRTGRRERLRPAHRGRRRALGRRRARLLLAGADKVAVNTAAVERPELLAELAERFGRQCVVLSVDATAVQEDGRLGGGRTAGGEDRPRALAWIAEGVERGAGEVLLTSIDRDGTGAGYDLDCCAAPPRAEVPVIASGGAGRPITSRRRSAPAPRRCSRPRSSTRGADRRPRSSALAGGGFPRGLSEPPHALASVDLEALGFEAAGLVPVVAQDAATGRVLMLAWANARRSRRPSRPARRTSGAASRQALWRKGETSGNVSADGRGVERDCDGDALLLRVIPAGPACHPGATSCFEPNPVGGRAGWLDGALELIVAHRAAPTRRRATPLGLSPRASSAWPRRWGRRRRRSSSPRSRRLGSLSGQQSARNGRMEEARTGLAEAARDLLYHLLVLLSREPADGRGVAQAGSARHRGRARSPKVAVPLTEE